MYRLSGAMLICAVVSGCVADSKTKDAAVQTSAVLAQLSQAQAQLATRYIGIINQTQDDMAAAYMARVVTREVESNANKGDEQKGNLFEVSRAVERAQFHAQGTIDKVRAIKFESNEISLAPGAVTAVVKAKMDRIEQEMIDAAKFAEVPLPTGPDIPPDRVFSASDRRRLEAIIRLSHTKAIVQLNLKVLGDDIKVFQAMHGVVQDWILTDVKPSGEEIGKLVDKHAALFGAATRPTTRPAGGGGAE